MNRASQQRGADEHAVLVDRQVERLRERLLDLSNRNRLLNFKHPEKSRKQARVIDELPAVLYERLLAGRSFRFRAVEEPAGQAAASRIAVADAARQQGLNPSFDLGARPATAMPEQHTDNFIQLLHYPAEMARRLEGMRQEHLTSLQELGVPSLYANFGFLEWYEKPDSAKPLLSPLVLVPLEIERMRERGLYQYRVSCSAEEPEPNRTLTFRLLQDVGLHLPDLEKLIETQDLDEYFIAVEAAIKAMPRWRLRRFVTVCAVSFARQVMYEDLAPERWKRQGSRGGAPLVQALLAGVDPATSGASHRSPAQPLLITEADSTQVAAIQEALTGRNMVIKGPPGTGKSQTITNLIAAALAANKKVLFVAEKMAALDVVKKRLDDAGLANFCLALHSTKAKKRDVLDALEASRQEHQRAGRAVRDPDPYAYERAQAVGELEEYLKTIASPFGSLGSDARQIVWREQAVRGELGAIEPGLLRLVIPGVLGMSTQQLQESARRIGELEASIAALGGPVAASPWSFVTHWDPLQHGIEATLHAVERWAEAVGELTAPLVELGWPAESLRFDELEELGAQLADLTHVEANAPAGLVGLLLDRDLSIATAQLVNHLEARCVQARRVESICPVDKAMPHRTRLLDLVAALQDANIRLGGVTYAELPERIARQRAASDALRIAAESLRSIGAELDVPGPWDKRAQRTVLMCGKLAVDAGKAILRDRVIGCLEDDVIPLLAERAQTAHALLAGRAAIDQDLRGWDALGAQALRRHATVLRSTGLFGRLFGSKYKASVAVYLSLSTGRVAAREVMASQLQRCAEQLEAEAKWLADPRLASTCGRAYRGLSTDFEILKRVAEWGSYVRGAVPGADVLSRWARGLLFSREMSHLAPLIEFHERTGSSLLNELERSDIELTEAVHRAATAIDRIDLAAARVAGLEIDGRTFVADLAQVSEALDAVATLDANIEASPARSQLGRYWQGPTTDLVPLKAAISASTTILEISFPSYVASWLVTAEFATRIAHAIGMGRRILVTVERERLARDDARGSGVGLAELLTPSVTVDKLRSGLQAALKAGSEALAKHVRYVVAREACRADAAAWAFCRGVDEAAGSWTGLTQVFDWCVLRSLCAELLKRHPKIAQDTWSGSRLAQLGQQVRQYEVAAVQHRRSRLAATLTAVDIPQGRRTAVARERTDLALLAHEISKQKRNVPIRELMSRAKDAILALTPCLMMSPLSIAQFLEDPGLQFDLLIVDEASQLRPEESIGALLRARQVVVVGDEQQLPPTSFFKRAEDEESDEEDEDVEAESLLDLAITAFGEPWVLRWHYRSRHESLIGFSNAQFYRGQLIVAPSPRSPGHGLGVSVEAIRGLYKASKNEPEANRVVELVFDLMKKHPRRSIGVVAINQQQSDLIRDRLDEKVRDDEIRYIDSWKGTLEPFFVKNLENVQGDERDIIVISMTYGPDETGHVFQRFGPIIGVHGHRRLNVLFSRAKHQLILVTSLRPEDVRAEVGSSRGVQAFRAYLEYAAQHSAASRPSRQDARLMRLVREIRDLGFDVAQGVGAQSLEIDLGISHPEDPSSFVAGVEVDIGESASLLRSADRELTRPLVLRQLGWSIVQTWTSDWLREPATARGRLRDALIEACRSANKKMPAPRAVVVSKPLDEASTLPSSALASAAPLLDIEVCVSDTIVSRLEVRGVRVRVGRGQQCEIRIPDQYEEVAAQHFELRWERGAFLIASVDLRAGIYVDGARVVQGSLLGGRTYTIRLGLGAVMLRLAHGASLLPHSAAAPPASNAAGDMPSLVGQVVAQLGPDERQFMNAIIQNGQIRTTELVALLGRSPVRVNGMVRQVRRRLHEAGLPAFFEDVRMPDGDVMYRRGEGWGSR